MIVTNIQTPFSCWLGLWLLYLILKSTSESNLDRFGVRDLVLGRKVPPIVFIKNRSLLKQIVTNELENDAELRQKVRLQAQYNEYIHATLKQNKISLSLDEKIGVTYFGVLKTSSDYSSSSTEHDLVSSQEPYRPNAGLLTG